MTKHILKIAVFSKTRDTDTDLVIDWLGYFGHQAYRFNGKNIINQDIRLFVSNVRQGTRLKSVDTSDFDLVWFRKGENTQINYSDFFIDEKVIKNKVHQFLFSEAVFLKEAIFKSFVNSKTINMKSLFGFNKIFNLKCATEVGLNIPSTMITSSRKDILKFKKKHKNIITKPIYQNVFFRYKSKSYSFYTDEVTEDMIEMKDESIFPTLVQEKINKQYEIRVFYLEAEVHSMAIFSSSLDYRVNYKENRYQLYKLPNTVEKKIDKLMNKLELQFGMIDLIKSKTGKYYFIEVNSSGVFNDMSDYCNLNLDEVFAKKIIAYAQNNS